MDAQANGICGLLVFFVVFGLQFFCTNCQRYPPQSVQEYQLQAVTTIPIQKDLLLSTENRLQSQVLPHREPFIVSDTTTSDRDQKEYYSGWTHVDNNKTEDQKILLPQRRPGKNGKRKRRPQVTISTTYSPPLISQEQYWRGHVEDEQPQSHPRPQPSEPIPTQISERLREPTTTKISEGIVEAFPSIAAVSFHQPQPPQGFDRNGDKLTLGYLEGLQRPLPTIFSEKIRQFNPTKESLIARTPITTTVFDKVPEPSPTRVLERNREHFSTKSSDKVLQEASPSRAYEKIREPPARKTHERNREPLQTRNSEKLKDSQETLEEEHNRDKKRQEYVAKITAGYHDKSYRRPYSQAKKGTTQQTFVSKEVPESKPPSQRPTTDLKEILKNSGGLSLSEILQQKNLSLDDLLKGKQNALLALQTTAAAPQKTESNSREHIAKPNRRIPQLSSTSTTTTTTTTPDPTVSDLSAEESSEQSGESQEVPSEEVVSKETKQNLRFPSRIRMSPTTKMPRTTVQQRVSTTTTTSRPKTTPTPLYQKKQQKSNLISTSGPSESKESRESVESQEESSTLNYPKRSRFKPNSTITTIVDQTDPASNFVEDSGENKVFFQTVEAATKENNSTTDQAQPKPKDHKESTTDDIYPYDSLKTPAEITLPHVVAMDIDLAEIDPIDDRTDLLELIEDRRSGNRLIKILEQRNMTLEELIEHRKRGSSQLHLATYIQNRSGGFPGKKIVVNDDMDIVTAFENFPHFNLLNLNSVKPDEIKTDSQGSSYFSSIIDIEPTDEVSKDDDTYKDTFPNPSSQQESPSWKTLPFANLATVKNAKEILQHSDPEPPQQTAQQHQSASAIEEDPVHQIEHEFTQAHDLVDLELSGHGFKRSPTGLSHTSQMPPSPARSAIVASVAIVLTSFVTFMMIFVACRLRHRRRCQKLDYMDTYNALRSRLPSRKTDDLATSTTSLGMESVPSRFGRSNIRQSQQHHISVIMPDDSVSTSGSKLNILSPNSAEFQDYLFDDFREPL